MEISNRLNMYFDLRLSTGVGGSGRPEAGFCRPIVADGFLGSVADCPTALNASPPPCPLVRFSVEPAAFRLGGATGPTGAPNTSPFGGSGGRRTGLWALLAAGAAEPMAFLACLHRFGCRWYMSSQARQKVWLEHSRQRTMASEVPHRSHVLTTAIAAVAAASELTGRPEATVLGRVTGGGGGGAGGGPISS